MNVDMLDLLQVFGYIQIFGDPTLQNWYAGTLWKKMGSSIKRKFIFLCTYFQK